jgi:hypothetical protein
MAEDWIQDDGTRPIRRADFHDDITGGMSVLSVLGVVDPEGEY